MKRKFLPFLIGLVVLLLGACGPQSVEYTIEMSEFAYSPDSIELSVGQEVTLNIVNMGALEHELMIGREVMMMEGNAVNFEHDMFENGEPMVIGGAEHSDGDEHDEGEEAEHMEGDEHMDGDDHDEGEEAEHMEGDEHMDEHSSDAHGFMVSVPGNSKDEITTITFTVTEDMVGEWSLGCFLDNGTHFAQGMTGTVVVSP